MTTDTRKPLTVKQDRFAFLIASGHSQEDAAKEAGFAITSSRHNAHRLMANEGIQQQVEHYRKQLARSEKLTPERVMAGLLTEAEAGDTSASRVSAWRTLADILGMTAGNRQQAPAGYLDLMEALGRGLAAGREAKMLQAPTVEILPPASPGDSEQDASE